MSVGLKPTPACCRVSSRKKVSALKKTVFASEQDRRDVAYRRAQWKKYQGRLDPARLVFIDEAWAKTNMTPTHGWSKKGTPLLAKAPGGHWQTMTFLAALRHNRITAPCVFDGPVNGERFLVYVKQALVPTLKEGDVVRQENNSLDYFLICLTMDNLSSHKSQAVRKAIRSAGARLFFYHHIRRTLIPLNRSSPNSNACSEGRKRERKKQVGDE